MSTADTLSLQIIVDSKNGQVTVKNLRQEIEQTTASFTKAGNEAKNSGQKMSGVWKQMLGGQIAFAALRKGYMALNGFVSDSISKFQEQERVEKQLETVLRSTGNVVGYTAAELKKMASGLQDVTAYGDESIIGAQNLLLTFTSIGHDVFPTALKAIMDVSTAMGQDLKSSVLQIGKALNDPLEGLGALTRVGIQFTAQQKNMIKVFMETGQVAKAQGIIIQELQRQFGGSAEAYARTTAGMIAQAKNLIGDLQEKFGGAIMTGMLPVLEKLKKWISENREEVERFATKAGEAIGKVVSALGNIASWITNNIGTIKIFGEAVILAFAVSRVNAFATALSTIPAIAGAAATSIAGILGPLAAVVAAAKWLSDFTQGDLVTNDIIETRQKDAVAEAAAYKEIEKAILAQGVAYSDLDEAIRDHQGYVDGVMMSELDAFEAMRKNSDHLSGPLKKAVEGYNEALKKLAETTAGSTVAGGPGPSGDVLDKQAKALEKQKKEIEAVVEKYYEAKKPLSDQLKAHLDNAQALGMNRDLVEKLFKAYGEESFRENLEQMPKAAKAVKDQLWPMPGVINDMAVKTDTLDETTLNTVSTWGELNAQADVFGRALGSVFDALDAIGVKSGGLRGVLSGALGGVSSGLGMLDKAGEAKNGSLNQILGAAGGYLSIASAGISVLTGIADILGFTKTGLDETVERLARTGVSIDENLIKKLEEARDAGKDVGAEMAKTTAAIIAQNDVTGQNFGSLSRMVRDVFMQFDNGRLSVEEATKAYGDAFTELAKKAEEAGKAGSKALADMIGDARNRGMVSGDMAAWIDSERNKGLSALPKHIEFLSKTQGGYNRALRDTVAMFDSMVADGKGYTEIIGSMGPALDAILLVQDDMKKKMQEAAAAGNDELAKQIAQQLAASSKYLSPLLDMQEFVKENGSVLDALNSTKAVMESMANTGILTADRFTDAQASMLDYYNQLMKNGGDEEKSLQSIFPMLAKQVWYAKEYGFELDEATKKLVEQAEAQGLKLDNAIPAEERMLKLQERMVDALEKMAGILKEDVPEGLGVTEDAWRKLADTSNKVKLPNYDGNGDTVNTGTKKIAGFASGTRGLFVTSPSLFSFAEDEPELLNWDGAGRIKATPASQLPTLGSLAPVKAGGKGGSGRTSPEIKISDFHLTVTCPNVRDPYNAQTLIEDVRFNRHGVRDVFIEIAGGH